MSVLTFLHESVCASPIDMSTLSHFLAVCSATRSLVCSHTFPTSWHAVEFWNQCVFDLQLSVLSVMKRTRSHVLAALVYFGGKLSFVFVSVCQKLITVEKHWGTKLMRRASLCFLFAAVLDSLCLQCWGSFVIEGSRFCWCWSLFFSHS